MLLTSPTRFINGYSKILVFLTVLITLSWLVTARFGRYSPSEIRIPIGSEHDSLRSASNKSRPWHAIDTLREHAKAEFINVLSHETGDLQAAAKAYLRRRGRRPPPGFADWYNFAKDHDGLIIEDFFDRIYHDLEPFWAIPALQIRLHAGSGSLPRISIRNGKIHKTSKSKQKPPWINLWSDMIGTVAKHLPDIDMPINTLDESRLILPWETVNDYMKMAHGSRKIVAENLTISEFGVTSLFDSEDAPFFDPEFLGGNYWDLAVVGCPPESAARTLYNAEFDYSRKLPLSKMDSTNGYNGFVQNWTAAKSPCNNPILQQLHGTFIEPVSTSTSRKLFPFFGGSKLQMNNEILLPPAMYWSIDPRFSSGKDHGPAWDKKHDMVMWRGTASGGRNRFENWTRFQRHRFVAMMNGTLVARAISGDPSLPNLSIPQRGSYNLTGSYNITLAGLGDWINKTADVAFTSLQCFPNPHPPFCSYTDAWFSVVKPLRMAQQYQYKYLPDLDGNSFSGRYRSFLSSTSLPIKATIYDEWHDSRLIPWLHFVPMDNTFVDLYGIMEYFLGYGSKEGHDDVAEEIATAGKIWAERVLRKEDMQIYVFRLLLEYARLCDDNRENLGWIGT